LLVLSLAGCAADPPASDTQDTDVSQTSTGTASATGTQAPAAAAVVLDLTANVTGLAVAFAFNGTGASWSLAFGDGNATNGTALPGAANHTYAAAGTYNATLTVRTGASSANRTLAVNVTAGASGPQVALLQESFSGSLPADGATTAAHTFTVPAGGQRLVVVYTSDHVGLFSAVAEVFDPAGTSKLYSLDACSAGFDPPAAVSTCEMVLEEALEAGDWSAEVYYQAGQVIEDYTLDVTAWGVAA
jgi:PKD repeat protein